MASVTTDPEAPPQYIIPSEIYGDDGPVRLRIATGGPGQTGLLKALADAFIKTNPAPRPFRIAWIATDTSLSFNALATGAADVSIVYHPYAASTALSQSIASSIHYAWRDSFLLVGPASNPAKLPLPPHKRSIYTLFAQLFRAAIDTSSAAEPVRFLSRYDKSAANIRESLIWASIGCTPWSEPYSGWYHRYVDFPVGALSAASRLGQFTMVDRGTWYARSDVRQGMVAFMEMDLERLKGGTVEGEDDALLNPAMLLVGKRVAEGCEDVVEKWVEWLVSDEGGQRVVSQFAVDGMVLHGRAPKGVDPLESVRRRLGEER